ncbi:MAG: site-specific DNA-methyltransferase [Planctomycetia bacterium]|nr:site-specific DNA-methyltransferase [Planctomycetia bacterium]
MGRLKEESVDLVFADPPFNIGFSYEGYEDNRTAEDYLAWCEKWLAGIHRVLKPDGSFWLSIGDDFAAELKVLATRNIGFTMRNWIVWYYTFGVHCKRKFTRSHTHLFYFVKDADHFTFNDETIRVPSARQLVYKDKRANPTGRIPDDTWILRPQSIPGGFDGDQSVWYFARVCGTFKERVGWHGCQMPEPLLERIINVSSNENDLVLDPFAGSGTTLAAAKKLKRQYMGFEISEPYCRECRQRLEEMTDGPNEKENTEKLDTESARKKVHKFKLSRCRQWSGKGQDNTAKEE